mmetsp:Transcript_573/g.1196  ORF Transcript_573/g.1196 Transcript_573/m.1196 type:complete len:220 (+) Transcript_573:1745-2404(+)
MSSEVDMIGCEDFGFAVEEVAPFFLLVPPAAVFGVFGLGLMTSPGVLFPLASGFFLAARRRSAFSAAPVGGATPPFVQTDVALLFIFAGRTWTADGDGRDGAAFAAGFRRALRLFAGSIEFRFSPVPEDPPPPAGPPLPPFEADFAMIVVPPFLQLLRLSFLCVVLARCTLSESVVVVLYFFFSITTRKSSNSTCFTDENKKACTSIDFRFDRQLCCLL